MCCDELLVRPEGGGDMIMNNCMYTRGWFIVVRKEVRITLISPCIASSSRRL